MNKIRYTDEQIIVHLREVEVHCSQGKTIAEAARLIGVTEQTYCRWRKQYGGINYFRCQKAKGTRKGKGVDQGAGSCGCVK